MTHPATVRTPEMKQSGDRFTVLVGALVSTDLDAARLDLEHFMSKADVDMDAPEARLHGELIVFLDALRPLRDRLMAARSDFVRQKVHAALDKLFEEPTAGG